MLPGLRALGARFGEDLGQEEIERLTTFVELLLEWNRAINLTGASTPTDLLEEHLPDSFALAKVAGSAPDLVDVGSGGGLPGVPFGILRPEVKLTLSEPRARRRAFLSQVVHRLGLRASVVADRAEAMSPGRFSAAVARAVLPPDEWLAAGGRLVGAEGRIVVLTTVESGWRPPAGSRVLQELRYNAGPRERLALACSVPRGTEPAGRST